MSYCPGAIGDRILRPWEGVRRRRYGRRAAGARGHGRPAARAPDGFGELQLLVEKHGVSVETREIIFGVRGRLDTVLLVEKVRDPAIGAGQLAEHIGFARAAAAIVEIAVGLGANVEGEKERVIAHGVDAREGRAVDAAQLFERADSVRGVARDGGRRSFPELAPGVDELALVEAEARRQGRIAPQALLRELFEEVAKTGVRSRLRARGNVADGGKRARRRIGGCCGEKITTAEHFRNSSMQTNDEIHPPNAD